MHIPPALKIKLMAMEIDATNAFEIWVYVTYCIWLPRASISRRKAASWSDRVL